MRGATSLSYVSGNRGFDPRLGLKVTCSAEWPSGKASDYDALGLFASFMSALLVDQKKDRRDSGIEPKTSKNQAGTQTWRDTTTPIPLLIASESRGLPA